MTNECCSASVGCVNKHNPEKITASVLYNHHPSSCCNNQHLGCWFLVVAPQKVEHFVQKRKDILWLKSNRWHFILHFLSLSEDVQPADLRPVTVFPLGYFKT